MSYNNAGPDTFPFSLTLTQPETIQFLFLSSGIILIVGGVVALKNFGRAPVLLSKIAFTFFYFLGPSAYFFFWFWKAWLWKNLPWDESVSGVSNFPNMGEALFLSFKAIVFFVPQSFIIVAKGLSRLLGISRFTFWLKRRFRLRLTLTFLHALRVLGALRLADWLKRRLMPQGGYEPWKVTWGSYVIFILGAVYTVWFMENFKG
ncbi:MAG: hypothetical protein ING10_18235 [Roseomonas sp.]|nr:hypothetical protein [Roseomonas sp.]